MINIWCYWSQGKNKIPLFHEKCLKNWENMLSNDFKINVIDLDSFLKMQNEIDENFMNKLTYQQQSDIVRLCLLDEYGGIWIDITSILTKDLSWVIDKFDKGYEQVGFYVTYNPFYKKEQQKNILENWFIAVKNKSNYIISQWKKTFINIMTESIKNNGVKNSKTWKETNKCGIVGTYLSMHVAHLWCLQNDVKYRNNYENNVYLYFAKTTALMSPITFKNALLTPILGYGHSANFPLIKLTSIDIGIIKKLDEDLLSDRLKYLFKKYLGIDYKIINKKLFT